MKLIGWRRRLALVAALVVSATIYTAISKLQIPNSTQIPNSNNQLTAARPPANQEPAATIDLPVLMYHYIRIPPDPVKDKLGFGLSVSPNDFRAQLEYLVNNGYVSVEPNDLTKAWQGKSKLPEKPIILTFDDGYADFYATAFPILREFKLKATLFVVADFVDNHADRYVSWNQILEMDKSGLITFGSHTLSHVDLTASRYAETEITKSKQILEEKLGRKIDAFAYPAGKFNDDLAKLIEGAGYQLAFTTRPDRAMEFASRFALPRVRVSGAESLDSFIQSLVDHSDD